MDIEQIRVRIMSEAYDLADRGDHEGYNAIKVMCGDVLELIDAVVAAEREACAKLCDAVQKKNEDDGAWMWEARNCAATIRGRGNT
jgi:hypothetical protein